MVCKNCKRQIDDDSIFCKWCGEKQIRERRKKGEVKAPKPRQLKSGEFIGQIMIDGTRHTVKGTTVAEYEAKCKAYKAGIVEAKRGAAGVTVGELVDSYIIKNSNVLSPSTLKGYKTIRRNSFQPAMANFKNSANSTKKPAPFGAGSLLFFADETFQLVDSKLTLVSKKIEFIFFVRVDCLK